MRDMGDLRIPPTSSVHFRGATPPKDPFKTFLDKMNQVVAAYMKGKPAGSAAADFNTLKNQGLVSADLQTAWDAFTNPSEGGINHYTQAGYGAQVLAQATYDYLQNGGTLPSTAPDQNLSQILQPYLDTTNNPAYTAVAMGTAGDLYQGDNEKGLLRFIMHIQYLSAEVFTSTSSVTISQLQAESTDVNDYASFTTDLGKFITQST